MAYEVPLFRPGALVAAGDLSASMERFVKLSGANTVTVCTVDGEFAIGVLQNKPSAAGQPAAVEIGGVTKIVASEAITAGMFVGTANDGRAKQVEHTATGADTGDWVLGQALDTVTQAGQLVTVLLGINYRVTS